MKAIINANIVLENGILWDGTLLIEQDRIAAVGKARDIAIPEGAQVIDAGGAYVGPGFVNIHVHGKEGDAFYGGDPKAAAQFFLKHGETSLLAAATTKNTYEGLLEGIRCVKEAMKTQKNIKGINIEGPYISDKYGASANMELWNYGPIDAAEYEPLLDLVGTDLKLMSVAPEREGLVPVMAYARKVSPDVVFSVGHSEATPEQIRALGAKFRPKLTTHMLNATGRTGASHGIRGRGPDEYCLADPEMYAELICDSQGIHVHPDMVNMVLKTKGLYRTILITDTTPYKGVASEEFPDAIDLNFNELGRLAGSKMTMDQACRNIMTHSNCGIAQAFIMASLNPARLLGMDGDIGSIEVGKKADFVFVDDKFNVGKVMQEGELCIG